SAKDMAAAFHQIQDHHDEISDECLYCHEQLRMASFSMLKSREITMRFQRLRWSVALISIGAFVAPAGIGASDLSAISIQGSQQPGNPTPNDPNSPNNPPNNPNGPNPPSGPNNPNPPSGPAPTAPSGPGGASG